MKIGKDDWDGIKKRVKINKKNSENAIINLWLEKMASTFRAVFRNYLIDGITPLADDVGKKIKEDLNIITTAPIPVRAKFTLFEFIKSFINDSSTIKSISTIKTYQSTFKHLKIFSTANSKELEFDDITYEFRTNFIKYLQQLGVGKNTEGKHIKVIKVFMNAATERGYNLNTIFRNKGFSKPTEDSTKVFLTKQEIQKLVDLDLSNDKMKDVVRDFFIISCQTSLRFSDFSNLKKENIKNDRIELMTQKTGEPVVIPISPWVKNILLKYNFNLPLSPVNQVFNRVLKDVGRQAGIDETVTITKTIGGLQKTISYKKYELLTCHTGRRSMISNCILAGISTPQIMLMSAHKSLKSFQLYIKISNHQNAEVLATHDFFNS